jgi:FkbM family methyltransferase
MTVLVIPLSSVQTLQSVVHRIATKRWPRGGVVCFYRNGVKLFGQKADIIDICLLDEPKTAKLIYRFCKHMREGIFFDLGAHIGAYSVVVGKLGLKVVAVEPSSVSYNFLRHNVMVNNLEHMIELRKCAVWDHSGYVTLIPKGRSARTKVKNIEQDINQKIKAITLEELFSQYDHIDLVKMDIEGSELTALRPFTDFHKIDNWIIEVENENLDEINGIMRKNGFKGYLIEKLVGTADIFNVLFTKNLEKFLNPPQV